MEREGEEGEAAADHSHGCHLFGLALLGRVEIGLDWVFMVEQAELYVLSPSWRVCCSLNGIAVERRGLWCNQLGLVSWSKSGILLHVLYWTTPSTGSRVSAALCSPDAGDGRESLGISSMRRNHSAGSIRCLVAPRSPHSGLG